MQLNLQKFQVRGPVFLIGFMGAGKSSVASKLNKLYGLNIIDTDKEIIELQHKTISEIFNDSGKAGFRQTESDVLKVASKKKSSIISCGGGCVEIPSIGDIFNKGFVVYLKVSPAVATKRVKKFANRPLFKDLEASEDLLNKRQDEYKKYADIIIDTDKISVDEVVSKLVNALEQEEILCR